MRYLLRPVFIVASVLLIASLPACEAPNTRTPIPLELASSARLDGFEAVRFVGDKAAGDNAAGFDERARRFADQLRGSGLADQPMRLLAVSGGGPEGAFGAGLLCGWTASGTRPEFHYVTGISTGALTAPFAFLGPEYDDVLREVYTTLETKDLVKQRGILKALGSESAATTDGLYRMIQRYMTDEVIDEIGRQHQRGRRLTIGTTNLDLMQPVYWRVSAIATSDHPGRNELIHKILLASAAIPGAFPPVYFDVIAADGKTYDEMHVDGGAATQVFAYPLTLDLKTELDELGINTADQRLYVIRNAKLEPNAKIVYPSLISITGRSISSLIKTQGIGDLFRIYLGAIRDEIAFHLAFIPADFDRLPEEGFDPVYMGALFDRGYAMAVDGYPWETQPPNFTWPNDEKWPRPPDRSGSE